MDKQRLVRALNLADEALPHALENYNKLLTGGIKFGKPERFVATPEKAYTAKTSALAQSFFIGEPNKTMYIIAFALGDGTGSSVTYSPQDLVVPDEFKFDSSQERVFPRSKNGVFMEAFFSLFSIFDNKIYNNTTCLEELSIGEDGKIISIGRLGLESSNLYNSALEDRILQKPKIQLTTGYGGNGIRFGDPHAIHYKTSEINPDAIQVGGFLAIHDRNSMIRKNIGRIAEIPEGFLD